MESIKDRWEAFNDEFLLFSEIKEKLSHRADVHAFILLDRIFPAEEGKDFDLIVAASRNEIYFDIDNEKIRELTDELIVELLRCGVSYDLAHDGLCMYV